MNRLEVLGVLRECLSMIAPGCDLDTVDPSADLREAIELDSMDMLNLIIALHRKLGVDIPEVDLPKLVTLNGAVDYLASRLNR